MKLWKRVHNLFTLKLNRNKAIKEPTLLKMSHELRKHLLKLICNANGKGPPAVSTSLTKHFKSDIENSNVILSIATKCISSILNIEEGIVGNLKVSDPIVDNITIKHFGGEPHYSFSICKTNFINDVLDSIHKPSDQSINKQNNKTIIVEYSSPNIAKPFHMGHLRSTVLGQYVANILARSNKVIRINYLGDWGTQFGLIQAGLENMSIDIDNIKENPLRVINEAYVKANDDETLRNYAKDIMSDLEQNNKDKQLNVWKKLRELTVKHLQETYKIIGVEFDEYTWESQYVKGFDPVLELMKRNQLISEHDNQLVVLKGEKKIPLMKSDGTSLYLSRDILAALDRYNRHRCSSIKYVIDKSQQDHVETVRTVVNSLTGKDIVEHIPFGKIIGMSTRKGTSVFLSDILEKATQIMALQQDKSPNTKDKSFEVTQNLAMSTLIIYFLKQRRTKDFTFDWDTALQSRGDTGVKLQYTHSRLCSLEQNCGVQIPSQCNPKLLSEPDVLKLIVLLDRFEEILSNSCDSLESSYLVNYAFKLCNATSAILKKLPVKGERTDIAQQRLLLFHKVRLVLKDVMLILGIKPLVKM